MLRCVSLAQGYSPEAALARGSADVPDFKAFRKKAARTRKPPICMEVYCEALADGEAFLKCVPSALRA